ncbi:MAG: DUF354 domain-containing protein [Bacillota bacterium]
MKTILFDINHPCDINLFKNVISKLSEDKDNEVLITYLERKPVPAIIKKELPEIKKKPIGKHRGTILSILFEANIVKFFRLFIYVLLKRPDLGVSFGSFVLGAVCKILRIKNIQYYDDPENEKNKVLQEITADELYYPIFFSETRKIKKFHALKEWAYLSPAYFTPNADIIKKYKITEKNYIFIREVSTKTTNYIGQESNWLYLIKDAIPESCDVILSLEDKSKRHLYPEKWILLSEPVEDIYSIIYYSCMLISSGDSMAREGALLGVPSIYSGERLMQANTYLENMKILKKIQFSDLNNYIINFFNNKITWPDQLSVRRELSQKFDDLNDIFLKHIKSGLDSKRYSY